MGTHVLDPRVIGAGLVPPGPTSCQDLWLEYVVKVNKTSEIKERMCTRSWAHYQST